MLPKLLTLLGLILQVGQFAMETYVRVRKIFPPRKGGEYGDPVMDRLNKLYALPRVLTRGEQEELIDLENRLRNRNTP